MAPTPRRITVSTVVRINATSRDRGDKNRWHYRTPIDAGVLDDTARTVYTRGQCHAAAAALAEQDTWGPVVVLVERDHRPSGDYEDTILHCYAVAPDGQWVDINGAHDPHGATQAWEDIANAPLFPTGHVTIETIVTDAAGARGLATRAGCAALGIHSESPLLPTNMAHARTIRPRLLDRIRDELHQEPPH